MANVRNSSRTLALQVGAITTNPHGVVIEIVNRYTGDGDVRTDTFDLTEDGILLEGVKYTTAYSKLFSKHVGKKLGSLNIASTGETIPMKNITAARLYVQDVAQVNAYQAKLILQEGDEYLFLEG